MDFKIFLFDLDFTLLRSDKTISDYTVSILKKAQTRGILLGFSTSRGNTSIQNYIDLIGPDIVICNAGACIYLNNKLIHTEEFTVDQTRTFFDTAYKVCGPDVEMTCDTLDKLFWNRKENKTEQYMPDAAFNDFKNFDQPVMKICVQTVDQSAADSIAAQVPGCAALRFSDIPWFKFAPVTATKENAIEFLSSRLGIPVSQMAAFGDDYSDIGMLKMCGKGIAVGNAIEPVKAITDEITDSCDDDGVAKWISKIL